MMRVRAKNSVRVISAIASAAAGAVVLQSSPAVAFKLSGPAKIAFIYENQAKDGGWDESLEAGRDAVQSALGAPTSMAENIPEDASKIRAAIDLYVKRGFNVIVGTTYGYSAPFAEAAKAYPKVAFLNASGTTNGDNLESFYARTYQGWYLAGIAAGYATHSQKVGMLAGFPIGVVNWDINAFVQGARSVDPKVEGIAVFTNSWWDPVKEGQVAQAILDQSADVLATDLCSVSALDDAEKHGAHSVGYQLDMSTSAPKGILTSVVFHWDKYLVPTIKGMIDGTWTPQPYGAFEGLETGVIDLTPFGAGVTAEARAKIDDARAAMMAGKLDPFQGPVKRQDGSEIVKVGAKIDDGDLWTMDYFVQGVIGSMPKAAQ